MPTASRAAASRRTSFPPEEDSPVTRCLTRSRYLCPVAPVVPPEMRAATADMPPDELRELCGKLEDGKKTFFAGDSLTLQIHNELICLCGVKVKRRSALVNLKGLSGSTVAQIFRKEVIGGGLRRGDRVIANFGSWCNKHQSSNWRKFSPQMRNLATEMRAARMRGAKLTWLGLAPLHSFTSFRIVLRRAICFPLYSRPKPSSLQAFTLSPPPPAASRTAHSYVSSTT